MRRFPSLLSSALIAATACTQSVELGGPATLVRIDAEAPGANCETGGVAIHTGLDVDDDRYLDDTEVSSTQYACSGVAPVACAGGTVLTTTPSRSGHCPIGRTEHPRPQRRACATVSASSVFPIPPIPRIPAIAALLLY